MTTRTAFLAAYDKALLEGFGWAKDDAKRARYLQAVRETIIPDANGKTKNTWLADGVAFQDAWRKIGCTGKANLKKLRALPLGETAEAA